MEIATLHGKRPIPEGHIPLQCDDCKQIVGFFDPTCVTLPVNPTMFLGLYHKQGVPYAFQFISGRADTTSWKTLTCPICHVPFFINRKTNKHKEVLKTPWGDWKIGDKVTPKPPTPENLRQQEIEKAFEEPEELDSPVYSGATPDAILVDEFHDMVELVEVKGGDPVFDDSTVMEDGEIKIYHEAEINFTDKRKAHAVIADVKDEPPEYDNVSTGKDKIIETPKFDLKEFRKKYPTKCQYCGKVCKNVPGRGAHEKKCHDNPENQS